MFSDLLSNLQLGSFTPLQILTNLLVALVLALVTSFVYRVTHSGYAYSRSYNITMVIVTMVITMMMMVIGNYLVLSLGLIGAHSVIRFRTAIKEPQGHRISSLMRGHWLGVLHQRLYDGDSRNSDYKRYTVSPPFHPVRHYSVF